MAFVFCVHRHNLSRHHEEFLFYFSVPIPSILVFLYLYSYSVISVHFCVRKSSHLENVMDKAAKAIQPEG